MLNIPYSASAFTSPPTPALSSGQHNLSLSWAELVWAAMTMGKPGIGYLLPHQWHSVSDLMVRAHTVYANLRESGGQPEQSGLFVALDPTEKSGASYFLGMLAAKIIGYRLLGTPWLFHLSMLNRLSGHYRSASRSQPDLIGLKVPGQYLVVEAKGRSRGYSASAMASAKTQTQQVLSVNGQPPALRVAVQAWFSPCLEWAVADPVPGDGANHEVQFDVENALMMYYSAFNAATQSANSQTIGNATYRVRKIEDIGVTIALHQAISEVIEKSTERSFTDTILKIPFKASISDQIQYSLYPDGTAIAVDDRWSADQMAIEPWLRIKG